MTLRCDTFTFYDARPLSLLEFSVWVESPPDSSKTPISDLKKKLTIKNKNRSSKLSPSEIITQQFPGCLALPLIKAGAALSLSSGTAYNMHSKGTFPVRVHKIGNKPIVYLHDLITYLEGGPSANDQHFEEEHKPKKKGRPTKAESLRKAGVI